MILSVGLMSCSQEDKAVNANSKEKESGYITPMPYPDGGQANGVIVAGASIWMSNSVADDQQKAAGKVTIAIDIYNKTMK